MEKESTVAFECVKMCSITETDRKQTKSSLNFQKKIQSQCCINCGITKSKHFEELASKICFK